MQMDKGTTTTSTDHVEDNSSIQSYCETLLCELDSNLQDKDISNWLNVDSDDQGYQLLLDEEIVQQVTSQQPEDTLEEEDEAKDSNIPRSGEVTEMLDRCLLWYERQPESSASAEES